ncbi:MAG: hypothetical protein ACQEWM_07015 [Actinomycetota bacterium]
MDKPAAKRRWPIITAIAVLLIAGLVAWAVAASGSAQAPSDSSSPAASSSAAGSAAPASTAAPSDDPADDPADDPTASPAAIPPPPATTAGPPASDAPIAPEAEPVAPTEPAVQAGVEVELAQVERVEGVASAPGEISGPAVRITLRITNGSSDPVNAGLVAVNAYYGAARTPANSIMQPGGDPFAGTIPPGSSATAVYLFEGDDAELADALIGVDAVPGQPTFTFRGDLR